MNSTTAKVTALNVAVLARTFKDSERVSNQIAPTDYPHLSRCLKAQLVRADGAELVLTDAGRQAIS